MRLVLNLIKTINLIILIIIKRVRDKNIRIRYNNI